MNLQEFLSILTVVFFTTGFITWLRVTVNNLSNSNKIDKSTAESLRLFRSENQ